MTTDYSYQLRETLVQLEGVSKSYGETPILRDVNLEIRNLVRPDCLQGQVVALLGPSGIGKTTLFRVLAGLELPDEGQVLLGADQKTVQRGQVGVVAQHYPLFAHRTVKSNLLVAGRQTVLKRGEVHDKAADLLERFGMADHADRYPAQLSGGQRQRVAIAQQFMCSDAFLLMDEPFSGLDIVAQENLIRFIRDIVSHDELMTFILITHDISAALQIADTVWVLGRDRNEEGMVLPGSRVQASFNLIERGLAWHEDIAALPQFGVLRQEIRDLFPRL